MIDKIIYSTSTYKQYLTGVRRVVSLVRPRLVHVYKKPIDTGQPFIPNYQSARGWTMRVFFVPEPMGLAMMGVGIAALLGLSRMRRR